jgi:preprotein translocase subunit SecB
MNSSVVAQIDAKKIRIKSVRMYSCLFETNPKFEAAEGLGPIPVDYDVKIERAFPDPQTAVVRFGIEIFKSVPSSPFSVNVVYEGLFETEEGGSESLATYAKYNALATLLPYIRETISSLTTKSGHAPLVIPPMNVQAMVDDLESEPQAPEKDAGPR